jgi:hypothetical protein
MAKRTIIIGGIIGILTLAGFLTWLLINQLSSAAPATETPDFATVLPEGKSAGDLGGWTRVSPPENDPVYAYVDTIAGVTISVSEQPLPASFQANTPERVAELASQYNATTELDASGTKVYIGASARGPQSVIFTKNNLLVLIKSQAKIEDAAWVSYVSSLN